MEKNTKTQTKSLMSKPVTDIDAKSLVELAGDYIPTDQTNKVAFINLVAEKNMSISGSATKKFGRAQDLLAFLYTCKRTGLDPIANQIHTQWFWDGRAGQHQMTIITGIDGFRLTAQRSGNYAGQDDAIFEKETLFNPITGKDEEQLVAKTTVYMINPKTGERMPVTATARWNTYAKKHPKTGDYQGSWKSMPHLMLAKCSEALALRKAFPQELSGLYTAEEMGSEEKSETKKVLNELPVPTKPQDAPQAVEGEVMAEDTKTDKNEQKSTKTAEKTVSKVVVDKNKNKEEVKKLMNANKEAGKAK